MVSAQEILEFWFNELTAQVRFKKSSKIDSKMRERFSAVLQKAFKAELFSWRQSPQGRLAEILLLDQFTRNIYRDTPESFAGDSIALVLAQEAVSIGADQKLPPEKRAFIYMPYMHSESVAIQDTAKTLFSQAGLESNLEFEQKHRKIIERFGRYPHRNAVLGRPSTPEEVEFLKQPGSSF